MVFQVLNLTPHWSKIMLGDLERLVRPGKGPKRARKKFGRRKVKKAKKSPLDFSPPEFFSHPFRLFPVPTNCSWVSEDGRKST